MRRPAVLTLAIAGLAAQGCGDPASTTTGPGGGGSTTSSPTGGTGGAGGSPLATCQGQELSPLDLPLSEDGLSVTIPCGKQALSVTVLDPAIFRLTFDPPASSRPSYAALPQPAPAEKPVIGSSPSAPGNAVVCTPDLRVEIDPASCHVRATDASGLTLLESPEGAGGVSEAAGEKLVRWSSAPGERYYGFGEKTGPLDKRGRKLVFYNTDAYDDAFGGYPPDADPLYASVPFFIGLRAGSAYGYFLDDTHRLTFDMAASDPAEWQIQAGGGPIDQYLFAGPSIASVVERYTRLTGRIPMPPRWALGFHQSRWGYSPDSKVLDIASELRARNLPADAMWLDIQHMDGFRSFTWDPATFPDPVELTSALASKGFHTVAILDPGIKIDPAWDVYSNGLASGHFLKEPGGQVYEGEVWPGPAVFPDFSDPAARSFWGSLLPRTLDKGVSGLWIDMNEPSNFTGEKGGTVPDDLVCVGDGVPTTMAEMHNVYALNEARATFEGMLAFAPKERPFVLTRAGYAGTQRYAAMWTGDAPSSWPVLQGTLPMLLGMGLSGLTFSGSDVGGYSGYATPEMYARWMQLGSFSPFFRAHVTSGVNDQEPWQFGVEVTDVSRASIEARYRLLPYLYSLFHEAHTTGAPILRPLVHEFQGDPKTHTEDTEAMLGPSLLFAPVLSEGQKSRSVYLPAGRWFEAQSGAAIEGPITFDVDVVLGALPTFVREGAIVPHQDLVQFTGEKPLKTLYLDVYPAEAKTTFALYEDDGHSTAHESGDSALTLFSTQRTPSGATLSAADRQGTFTPVARDLLIRVRRVDHPPSGVALSGQPLSTFATEEALLAAPTGYFYDERDLSIVVKFPDPGKFDLTLDYDPSLTSPAPDVLVELEITVPAGTPDTPPIHFASSANGWTHQPLSWIAPGKAGGLVSVPRGKYFFYKYTRGDWATVEKYPACVEAENRYEMGKAHPVKKDTVWEWADQCQ
ncbi:MAG: glycoside hydrolase family 31 protein [Polyangiaceae bacterium]